MSVRYHERTGVWEFDSADEARAFARERPEGKQESRKARPPAAVQSQALAFPADQAARFAAVLKALAKAHKAGMSGEVLAPIAGLKGPQGLAGFSESLKKYLRATTNQEDVSPYFWNKKEAGRPATWFADLSKLKGIGGINQEEKTP